MRWVYLLGGLLAGASGGSAQHQHRHPMITAGGGNLGAVDVLRGRQEQCELPGDTPCAGGPAAGCCPDGAACIVSEGIPACDALCLGNQCAVGGCCGPGLLCPTVAAGLCSTGGGVPVPSVVIPSITPPALSFSDITIPSISTTSFYMPTLTPFPSDFTLTAGGGGGGDGSVSFTAGSISAALGSELSTFTGGDGGGGVATDSGASAMPTFTSGDNTGSGNTGGGILATSATATSSLTGGAAIGSGGSGGSGLLWGALAMMVGILAL